VRGYPLIVTPSIDEAQVLANWWHEARLVGTAAATATIAILVLLAFLYRLFDQVATTNTALRASEEATRRQADILSTLTENLPIGDVSNEASSLAMEHAAGNPRLEAADASMCRHFHPLRENTC